MTQAGRIALKESQRRRDAKAQALRTQAGKLDGRALSITRQMAILDGERVRLFVHAESLRRAAEELEG